MDICFGSNSDYLAAFFSTALKKAKGFHGDGKRQSKEFRQNILAQDLQRCSISGDVKTLEATHIVDRYIGSPLFGAVLEAIGQACSLYDRLPSSVLDSAQEETAYLLADIRVSPGQYMASKPTRIDQLDNGEALSPSLRHERDIEAGYCVDPTTGVHLWFNLATADNRASVPDFGALASSAPPFLPPDSLLYSNQPGKQEVHDARFFPRTLALYTTFCKRFLPRATKEALAEHVLTVTAALMAGDSPPSAGVARPHPESPNPKALTDFVASKAHREAYADVWLAVAEAQYLPSFDEEEMEEEMEEEKERELAEHLEGLHPYLRGKDLPVEEVERYHRDAVMRAIFLLHLGAAIAGNSRLLS
ncbi:hypothetical protein B0H17DRAFT_178821 [Mycena rosella]|uniref:Uncharacterized protein n=1 Tax=Mycena rosella TaxID=1033263 RepID=A0AAD7D0C0_MYCRO|nr:hypothetical protein B0H17DRAFT_178821 [Mycena rosella]